MYETRIGVYYSHLHTYKLLKHNVVYIYVCVNHILERVTCSQPSPRDCREGSEADPSAKRSSLPSGTSDAA